ncbi:hypothetical protein GCM10010420_50530 [Streptomyces glaucosporus]|uniref:Uncharacterized protein n=1 Tax=Streptomyces glaucosporus TaxID=284044 RepID=A0ABP5W1I5_9ACTN
MASGSPAISTSLFTFGGPLERRQSRGSGREPGAAGRWGGGGEAEGRRGLGASTDASATATATGDLGSAKGPAAAGRIERANRWHDIKKNGYSVPLSTGWPVWRVSFTTSGRRGS